MANIIDKCNIFKQRCQTTLLENERECFKCHGHGGYFLKSSPKSKTYVVAECIYCVGTGKVDWIQFIQKRPLAFHRRVIDINMKCPTGKGYKCKSMKRLWKQAEMRVEYKNLYKL